MFKIIKFLRATGAKKFVAQNNCFAASKLNRESNLKHYVI